MRQWVMMIALMFSACAGNNNAYEKFADRLQANPVNVRAAFCAERALELHRSGRWYRGLGVGLSIAGATATGAGTVMTAVSAAMADSEGAKRTLGKGGVLGVALGAALLSVYAVVNWTDVAGDEREAAGKMIGAAARLAAGETAREGEDDPFDQCIDLNSKVARSLVLNGGARTQTLAEKVKAAEDEVAVASRELEVAETALKSAGTEGAAPELQQTVAAKQALLEVAKRKLQDAVMAATLEATQRDVAGERPNEPKPEG